MEKYADAAGNLKRDFLRTPKWEVFVSFLLTQLDMVCFVLSWGIAINLAIFRAIMFFVIDIYRKDTPATPQEAIDSSPSKDLKPDDETPDDDTPDDETPDDEASKDGKPSGSQRHGKVLLKRDSGLGLASSIESNESGSPVHHDSAGNIAEAKAALPVVAETK